MEFLDIKTDYAFKKVFGSKESKHILKSFLNSVLDLKNVIVSVQIEDPYNVPKLKGMKDTAVDVKATLDDNRTVIIEMQVINHDGFESRILYNAAKNYANQLDKGHNYDLLNPVIALTIVNFDMFKCNRVKSSFQLLEKESLAIYNDDIELVFLELPNFTKKNLEDCETIEDKWLFFIKNANDLTVVPQKIDNDLREAFDIANKANLTKEEKELQEKREEFLFIQSNSILRAKREGLELGLEQGIEKGIEQGIEKGIEQGIEKGIEQGIELEREKQEKLRAVEKKESAKQMLSEGLNIELVSKFTGLSIGEIEQL